ncbi:MAG: pyridoxamine kinase [Clostridia bacterium]|nr:pyridoxamine kinase [Clostridia bacterium]
MGQKRVAAIHDISCFGKCSLTVALPVISAAGIETSVVPTAVLSTHTADIFTNFTFRDLTDDLLAIANHWHTMNLHFDAIYTGYLGSIEQVDIVAQMIDLISSPDTKIIIDPVMADHGKLYTCFSDDFPKAMARLCSKADVIIPNMTEAAFLLGEPYIQGPYTEEYCADLAQRLCKTLGVKQAVLTGVYFNNKKLGAACFDNGKTEFIMNQRIEKLYHGTGDVFGSALVAALVKGQTLNSATKTAVEFTCASIERTISENPNREYGVNFEGELPLLIKKLGI